MPEELLDCGEFALDDHGAPPVDGCQECILDRDGLRDLVSGLAGCGQDGRLQLSMRELQSDVDLS